MTGIKVILGVVAVCSALAAITLLWNESRATCGVETCKLLESIFIIVALGTTKECVQIKIK